MPTAPTVAQAARQRLLEALARRAQQHQGPARHLLDARLQQLQQQVQQIQPHSADAGAQPVVPLKSHPPAAAPTGAQPAPEAPQPLRELLAYITAATAHQSGLPEGTAPATALATPPATPHAAPRPAAAPELKAISQHRSTWSRLSTEQRLHQALAKVPSNAGPLNTQRLLHQALAAMRDASPHYLHRFMVQVETLLWLEQLGPSTPPAGDRKTSDKKPAARSKR